jgi:hypothetical protein
MVMFPALLPEGFVAGKDSGLGIVRQYPSSCPGLTRASIDLQKTLVLDGLPGQARQ